MWKNEKTKDLINYKSSQVKSILFKLTQNID